MNLKKETKVFLREHRSKEKRLNLSGVLLSFIKSLAKYPGLKPYGVRQDLINHCIRTIILVFDFYLELSKIKALQRSYIADLNSDLIKVDKFRTGEKSVQQWKDLIDLKLYIARHESNFASVTQKDFNRYALVYFLNELFRGMKVNDRYRTISNLMIYFNVSSAICGEIAAKTGFYRIYPVGYSKGTIYHNRKWYVSKKLRLHSRCDCLVLQAGDNISSCREECIREIQNIEQRLKRAQRLFRRDFGTRHYKEMARQFIHQYKKDIRKIKQARTVSEVHIPMGSLRSRFKRKYILGKLEQAMAQQKAYKDIYIEDLVQILRKHNVAGYKVFDYYTHLDKDRKYCEILKIRFHSYKRDHSIPKTIKDLYLPSRSK